MITGINHVTLSVRNVERSVAFYVDVLGCRPVVRWDGGAYLLAGTLWLAVLEDPQVRDGPLPEYTHVAFTVPAAEFAALSERIVAAGAGDRGGPVLQLALDIQQLSRLPVAAAEVAVVEHQAGVARLREPLRKAVQAHFLDGAEAMGHHDNRVRSRGGRQIKPATAWLAGGRKRYVVSVEFHGLRCDYSSGGAGCYGAHVLSNSDCSTIILI